MSTSVVDATVPTDWSARFIGHQVWVKGEWEELVDVWIEDGCDRDSWISRRRATRGARGTRVSSCARNSHIRGVNRDQCTLIKFPDGNQIWEWNVPPGPPLPLAVRPRGWAPPAAPPRLIDVTPRTHQDQDDELALFTL